MCIKNKTIFFSSSTEYSDYKQKNGGFLTRETSFINN